MKSIQELREIFQSFSWGQMNVHVHTHLCDGRSDMTVEHIASKANGIIKATYPAMLGHFFAAHSHNGPYNWFGLREEHLPIMKQGAEKVLEACKRTGAFIDITGIRIQDTDICKKRETEGFLFGFQKWFLGRCKEMDIITCPGGDAHDLSRISGTWFYEEYFKDVVDNV